MFEWGESKSIDNYAVITKNFNTLLNSDTYGMHFVKDFNETRKK